MKEQFTQGDWSVSYGTLVRIGDIHYDMQNPHDAHLIAAAPKMYRLLQKFLPCDEDGNGKGDFLYSDGSEFMGEEVTKLLAEARGENNE